MKIIRYGLVPFVACFALALAALYFSASLHAQDAAPVVYDQAGTVVPAAAQPELPAAAKGVIETLVVKFPWVSSVLSIYAAAAIGWQILCAAAHNWAARTSDLRDNQWLAKLETLWWFRWADKFFYFGGYFGSWAGGKKL